MLAHGIWKAYDVIAPQSAFHETNWGTWVVKDEAIKFISGWKNLPEICLKIAGSSIH